MKMLELQYKNKQIKTECWDTLSANELIELFRRINAQWYELSSRLELSKWIYSKQCSVKFLIKKIKISRLQLYGPSNGFRNMTMAEFLFADTYYFTYLRDADPLLLDKFIASIFRERRPAIIRLAAWSGLANNKDYRCEFNETLIDDRAKLLKNLAFETKQAILFNYGAVRKDMTIGLKYLFPVRTLREFQGTNQTKKAPAKKQIHIPKWEDWIWKLASGNSDEDFDKIANSLVRNVLKKIDTLIYESKKK